MASIDTSGGDSGHKKGPGVKKAKKLSTRVDMTPMVDLGFLLITFFVFTATMTTPTTLDLNMPKDIKDEKEQTETKESSTLTILLGKNNHVYYYEGQLKVEEGENNFKTSTFKEIRNVILNKKKEVISRYVPDPECEAKAKADGKPISNCADKDFVVIIKPNKDATYKNTVDILDEMTINQVRTYAMVKIGKEEQELIDATEANSGE
ncbi:MAG TPA: biopolymer transporter ExbD [Chitinophagaceae bacterium]|nr:biopolymer transporter ExbD [Chitinophagaceae bacterium]MCB9054388.1 biopolymer transporter ExbD [Chitinophagales bacterium]HPG11726.1 biopolymer transporter ExbD [Chitinophagaceae bacterium]HRX93908.1 biopolymer transporter ExbD [Chitinophagaceae bacterium]